MAKKPVNERTHKASADARRHGPPRIPRTCTHPNRQRRREMAEKRLVAWQALTPAQQLEELKARPGKCEKQITRLLTPKKNTAIVVAAAEAEVPAEAKKAPAKTDIKAQKAKKRREAAQAQS